MSFSLINRYSWLHSHSHTLHNTVTRLLQRVHDAPLHNNTTKMSLPRLRRCTYAHLHCRRGVPRPVITSALCQGWLPLSQPPGCPPVPSSLSPSHSCRGLSRRSGLFPSRLRSLSPAVSLLCSNFTGIRSLADVAKMLVPLNHPVALPPGRNTQRCT